MFYGMATKLNLPRQLSREMQSNVGRQSVSAYQLSCNVSNASRDNPFSPLSDHFCHMWQTLCLHRVGHWKKVDEVHRPSSYVAGHLQGRILPAPGHLSPALPKIFDDSPPQVKKLMQQAWGQLDCKTGTVYVFAARAGECYYWLGSCCIIALIWHMCMYTNVNDAPSSHTPCSSFSHGN